MGASGEAGCREVCLTFPDKDISRNMGVSYLPGQRDDQDGSKIAPVDGISLHDDDSVLRF